MILMGKKLQARERPKTEVRSPWRCPARGSVRTVLRHPS